MTIPAKRLNSGAGMRCAASAPTAVPTANPAASNKPSLKSIWPYKPLPKVAKSAIGT